jgi:hypothetical protein
LALASSAADWGEAPSALVWARFRRHRLAVLEAGVLLGLAPVRLRRAVTQPVRAGGAVRRRARNRFGADELGCDVMTRSRRAGCISLVLWLTATSGVPGLAIFLTQGFPSVPACGISSATSSTDQPVMCCPSCQASTFRTMSPSGVA